MLSNEYLFKLTVASVWTKHTQIWLQIEMCISESNSFFRLVIENIYPTMISLYHCEAEILGKRSEQVGKDSQQSIHLAETLHSATQKQI